MSDKDLVIDMEDDTEGHGNLGLKIVESGDADWLEERLRKDSGKSRFRITLGDEDDTEGHGGGGTTLRLNLADDDDTEGHAIAVHFPSRAEADAFRRRLLVTGVLVGTVALGAAGGIGLSALQSDTGAAGAGTVATQQAGPMDVHEAPAFQAAAAATDVNSDLGIMDASGAGAAAAAGPMDAHEAPAFQGLSQSDQAYADRLAGLAAASQTGPMDAHEAPAFQAAAGAAATDADSDMGIMDASETGASTAPSYVDAARNAALASQAASDDATTGAPSYVDAARAEALANQAADDDSADSSSLKGNTPR